MPVWPAYVIVAVPVVVAVWAIILFSRKDKPNG